MGKTPNKSEIEAKAVEDFFKDQYQKGFKTSITPEASELKESGYWNEAKDSLMRNEEGQFLDYIEKVANENGYELTKSKEATQYCQDLEPYPISLIMKEGCFCVGGRGSGKSNLLKLLTREALRIGVKVKVIDSTLTWKNFGLPVVKIRRKGSVRCSLNQVYDVSRLSVLEIRSFVKEMMTRDFEEGIALTDIGHKIPLLYVIEESQNVILPNSLRTLKFQEVSRFVTQGRNFHLSYLCSTQRLASTDTSLVEISGVKYWFKLEGQNNLAKARAWLPKFTVFRLRDLEVGQCYLQVGSKIRLLRLPKFGICNKAKIALMSRDVSNPNATVLS